MARKRSERLERLVEVQRRIEQLAEVNLSETRRERDRVRRSMEGVVDALGSFGGVHVMFSQVYARRIAALTMKEQRLEGLAGVQERRLRAEQAKGDRLEDGLKAARAAEERADTDEELYDLIDRLGAPQPPQASVKLRDP